MRDNRLESLNGKVSAESSTGSTARFDAKAPHATTYTYLHRKPGEHRFKAFGANAQGIGPESAEAVVTIAQANAA